MDITCYMIEAQPRALQHFNIPAVSQLVSEPHLDLNPPLTKSAKTSAATIKQNCTKAAENPVHHKRMIRAVQPKKPKCDIAGLECKQPFFARVGAYFPSRCDEHKMPDMVLKQA